MIARASEARSTRRDPGAGRRTSGAIVVKRLAMDHVGDNCFLASLAIRESRPVG